MSNTLALTLADGKKVVCTLVGDGKHIAYICGPGSFYLKGLSSTALGNQYTFLACDDIWTYGKYASLQENELNLDDITKDSIKQQDHLIIKALKKHFHVEKISLFGFSAPGALAFELALDYPEDVNQVIGTGIGLIELDSGFTKTTTFFNEVANDKRKKEFYQHQETYRSSPEFNPRKNSNSLLNQKKLKPHHEFLLEAYSNVHKLFYNYETKDAKKIVDEHWRHNINGKHINKRMQAHFFINIYNKLTPLQTLRQLVERQISVLLIFGDHDFITPLPENIKNQLQEMQISFVIIPEAGHLSYVEQRQKYADAVINANNLAPGAADKTIRAKL